MAKLGRTKKSARSVWTRLNWTPISNVNWLFEAVSPVKNVVHIRVPKASTTLIRTGGTETMTVDTFTISGSANRNVVAKQPFTFKVGGTLHVAAGQREGTYTGTFDVDIQYP